MARSEATDALIEVDRVLRLLPTRRAWGYTEEYWECEEIDELEDDEADEFRRAQREIACSTTAAKAPIPGMKVEAEVDVDVEVID